MGCSHAPSPPNLLCSSPATRHLYPSAPARMAHVASRPGNRSDKKVDFFLGSVLLPALWKSCVVVWDEGWGEKRRKGREFRVGGLNHSFQGLPGFLDDESVQLTADLLHLVRPGIQTWASATQHKTQPSAASSQSLGFKRFNSPCQHICHVRESPPNVFQQSLCSIKDRTECSIIGSILHS